MILMVAKCLNFVDDLVYEIDSTRCKSIKFDNIDRKDVLSPSFGLVSNGGQIVFKGDIVKTKTIYKIKIYLKNTTSNYEELIGAYFKKSAYSQDDNIIKMDFGDRISSFESFDVALSWEMDKTPEKTGLDIYNSLVSSTNYRLLGGNAGNSAFAELDEETENHLSNIKIPFPYLKITNGWNGWAKFAEATLTHISVNTEGLITVKFNGGR